MMIVNILTTQEEDLSHSLVYQHWLAFSFGKQRPKQFLLAKAIKFIDADEDVQEWIWLVHNQDWTTLREYLLKNANIWLNWYGTDPCGTPDFGYIPPIDSTQP